MIGLDVLKGRDFQGTVGPDLSRHGIVEQLGRTERLRSTLLMIEQAFSRFGEAGAITVRPRPAVIALGSLAVAAAALLTYLGHAKEQLDVERRAKAHLRRGVHLFHQKAYPEAEAELRRALRVNPREWKPPFYVGAIQIERKRYGLAIPYLERALTLNPTEPKILNALGVVYFKVGRLDMARGYFSASLDLDPTNSDAQGLMETMAKLLRRAERATAVEE